MQLCAGLGGEGEGVWEEHGLPLVGLWSPPSWTPIEYISARFSASCSNVVGRSCPAAGCVRLLMHSERNVWHMLASVVASALDVDVVACLGYVYSSLHSGSIQCLLINVWYLNMISQMQTPGHRQSSAVLCFLYAWKYSRIIVPEAKPTGLSIKTFDPHENNVSLKSLVLDVIWIIPIITVTIQPSADRDRDALFHLSSSFISFALIIRIQI